MFPRTAWRYRTKGKEPKIINILIVNSIFILSYFPIDISDVENPPVASVVIEWAIESKVDIPNIQSNRAQSIVRTKYIIPIILAIWAALGKTFSDESADSVWNNCIPPTFNTGKKEIAITIIPMPPIHCNNERQIKIPWGRLSRPDNIVEPVVVMPDIDSKKASVKDSSKLEKIKGNEPKKAMNIQLNVVNRNVCFIERLKLSDLLAKIRIMPKKRQINDEKVKDCHWLLP